jgi:hypothetical protein
MEAKGELQYVQIHRGTLEPDGSRLDRVVIMQRIGAHRERVELLDTPTDVKADKQWRWRLTPGYIPAPTPDPIPSDMFYQRAQEAKSKWLRLAQRRKPRARNPLAQTGSNFGLRR